MKIKKESLYKELIKKLSYLKEEEINDIKSAYLLAEERHRGQLRKTNEEYIIHPLNVAIILTEIKADAETIIAGLLHDVLEDTNTTKVEIEEKFGPTVLKLVDGVTKINSLNISTENEYLTSYYKKIIVGMSEDVRVIIIKLADRLHNMRTLDALPIPKQKEKAHETLEILAPIAHRLGMHKIKSELEDLSLKYSKPDVYYDVVEKLNNIDGLKIALKGRLEELKQQDYHGKRAYINIEDTFGFRISSKVDFGVHKHLEIKQEEFCFDVALQEDGETLQNSIAMVVPAAAGNFFNVSLTTFIIIPCGCCVTVSVENISETTAIDVTNANIIFDRVA